MRPARDFPNGASEQLSKALKQAKTKAEFQRIQCLWLRASLGLNADQVATALGWQPTSVRRLQAQYLKDGDKVLQSLGRGGRRNENLTVEQERELLTRFSAQAEVAETLAVSQIKRAYEESVGHRVPKSTIYRMLARHGWSKTAPRRLHPESSQQHRAFKRDLPGSSHKFPAKKPDRSG